MLWQQTIMTILKYAWVVWLIHGHEPWNHRFVLVSYQPRLQDIKMSVKWWGLPWWWKSHGNRLWFPCDRSHLLPIPFFLFFCSENNFKSFSKEGQLMSSHKVVWYWVHLPEFSPLLFAIHCNSRSQSLSRSSPSSKVLPATASPYSGRSGVALATPSAPCSPCYTAAGAVVYSRGKRFGWSIWTKKSVCSGTVYLLCIDICIYIIIMTYIIDFMYRHIHVNYILLLIVICLLYKGSFPK